MVLRNFINKCFMASSALRVLLCSSLSLAIFTSFLWAQANDAEADTVTVDAVRVNAENPQLDEGGGVKMETILVNNFEDADLWYGSMFIDEGVIRVTKKQGAPVSVREANPEGAIYVLGAKVNFFKRTYSRAAINPPQPKRIPGITKTISIWVNGKNRDHTLYALVRDMRGRPFKVRLGSMNFSGWKKLSGNVPDYIIQDDPNYATPYRRRGLEFMALLMEFDVNASLGVFFAYFDNLEIETNIYHEEIDIENAKLTVEERSEPLDDW